MQYSTGVVVVDVSLSAREFSEYKILAGGSDGRLRSKIACELIFLPKFYCELKELGFIASLRCYCALRFDDLQRMFP